MSEEKVYKQGFIFKKGRGSLDHGPDPERCCVRLMSNYTSYQCHNKGKVTRLVAEIDWRTGKPTTKPVKRLYCGVHDPARVEERERKRQEEERRKEEAREAIRNRKRAEESFQAACVAAIREIANGHNDARGLAMDVMKKEPAE
jgi:hypothetical protein